MSKVRLTGSTSGFTEITAPAVAGNNTVTLPASGAGSLIASSDTGTVSTAMLADSSVSTAKLADGGITAAKLSTSTTAGVGVGYVRSAGAGVGSGSASFGHMTFEAANGIRMLIQWGLSPSTSTSALTSANFHQPFKSGAIATVTCEVTGIVFGFTRTTSIGAISSTSFEYQVRDDSNTALSNGIRWIAIGEAP